MRPAIKPLSLGGGGTWPRGGLVDDRREQSSQNLGQKMERFCSGMPRAPTTSIFEGFSPPPKRAGRNSNQNSRGPIWVLGECSDMGELAEIPLR